jgi:cyclohexyl-isocyanide hydratase
VNEQNMNRHELTLTFWRGVSGSAIFGCVTPFEQVTRAAATALPMQIAMLIHADMVLLDLVGPHTVFSLITAAVHSCGGPVMR